MSNHYQTLGVGEQASPDEIKRAYRKLAMDHHPDRGGDQQKFQEIQNAYATLSDQQKRQQYDAERRGGGNFHFSFNGHPFQGGGMNMDDIFSQFGVHFGGPGGDPFAHMRRRNRDIRVGLRVDLSSTLNDQQQTINLQTTNGTSFTVDVKIPRGVANGTTVKYPNLGDNSISDLPRGDLLIQIELVNDTEFDVQNSNLIKAVQIDCLHAMIGTETDITGIDGQKLRVKIPRGTQHGTQLRVTGQGLWIVNTQQRGDLYVIVHITVPTLSDNEFSAISQLVENRPHATN